MLVQCYNVGIINGRRQLLPVIPISYKSS